MQDGLQSGSLVSKLEWLLYFFLVAVLQDCESDVRLSRRITRDTSERGRSVEDVIRQYHETVRPMHLEYVEPSKREADIIVHSTGHSLDVAIKTLTNHLRMEAGIETSSPS